MYADEEKFAGTVEKQLWVAANERERDGILLSWVGVSCKIWKRREEKLVTVCVQHTYV